MTDKDDPKSILTSILGKAYARLKFSDVRQEVHEGIEKRWEFGLPDKARYSSPKERDAAKRNALASPLPLDVDDLELGE